ncbi:bifunctional metallophosphatase/5'-nucleotidase [Caldimonas tepidiphila]|uniref:bifunctional metallophosphatase/5'-nucleotidase n=1 Tax=Caldimonas tepidiphila TaxID=2315841 RepID=UPI000E5C181A|nr:5'-nucleotidase C-terminal domain-containing protein [Caldimonas tepidiphila]
MHHGFQARKKHFLALAATLLAAAALPACGGDEDPQQAQAARAQPLELTLLHVNDHHSRLDAETVSLKLRNAAGTRESITTELGGFARVTAAMKELAAASPHVLKLHAGDALTGDLHFNLTEGKADAELMNTVCFDAFTLGNHEFDNGDAGLRKFVDFLHAGACKTPVLSANVRFAAASPMQGRVAPSVVLVRGGQKIGIVGLTIAGKTQNASRPDAGTVLGEELAAAQAEIDRLRAQGIDKIVLQTHLGYDADLALAPKLSGVDVIVGADSHTLLGPDVLKELGLTPAGPYPTQAADKDGKRVCIVQAWQYSHVVGELKVSFDARGDVTACSGTPHLLIGDSLRRGATEVDAADRAAMRADIGAARALRVTAPDAAAAALLAPYAQQKAAFGAQTVGEASAHLCLRRVPGTKLDPTRSSLGDACNKDAGVIAHGGDIQQIVAEAFLQSAREFFAADLSIQNGGGVRADIRQGPVTVKDVYTVLPFRNTLVQLNATGAEIKAALEDAVDAVVTLRNTGGYPYAGGLRFDVNLDAAKGSRLSNLQLRQADGGYQALDPARSYRVATTNFLADGGDYYATLATIKAPRRSDVGLDYAEALLKYFQRQPGQALARLPVADYSTQAFTDLP